MGKKLFNKIIEPENLFFAWDEFKRGKTKKYDVLIFERHLEENIFELNRELKEKTYKHRRYSGFYVTDPKLRRIHKADIRDRVLHHSVFNILNPIFEPMFTSHSLLLPNWERDT